MTSLLDELYFVITFPLVFLLIGQSYLISSSGNDQLLWLLLIGYLLKLIYSVLVFYGLLINPRGLKWLLLFIFKFPLIRRWRPHANQSGDDLLVASRQFKNWPLSKWFKAIVSTAFSWTSRYWVVNSIVLMLFGYHYLSLGDHLQVFAKQLYMWIMMLIAPTPGGSGFAELIFKEFLGGNLPVGIENFVAFIWRVVTYYPYLIIGSFLIPRWIRKHFIRV